VSSERESVLEDAPSFQGFDHVTDHLHLSESPLGPDLSIDGNELIHTGETHANTADAWPCKAPHGLDSEASFLQPPISFELGPEEGPNMFASLFGVLSSFSSSSSSSLSRSSSTSSSSSVPVLSPDLQTQWGGDSPSPTRSPNRSSSEESAPPDFGFDEDIVYPPSRTFGFDDWHSENIDFLPVPGGFSTVDDFEPGTSAGTIRPLVNSLISDGISTPDDDWSPNYGDYATPEYEADIFDEHLEDMGETVDGGDREYRSNGRDEGIEGRQSSNGRGNGGQDWRQASAGGSHSNGHGSGGQDRRGGGSDDRRNDERDWGAPSTYSTPSDTESEDSEREGARRPARPSHSDIPGNIPTSGDDDVPLARSIPTALRAQRTIRRQVRDEKDERRRRRLLRRQQRQEQQQQQTHSQTSLNEDSRLHMQVGPTLSQGPTQPASSSARATRPRTKTLPSNSSRPIVAEDLSRRLRDIQEALPVPSLKSHSLSPSDSHSRSDQLGQRSRDYARVPNVGIQDKSLRPARSFHRPSPAGATREQPTPMPALALETHRLGRSATTASRPVKQRDQPEVSARATSDSYRSTRRPRTSDDAHQPSTPLLHPSVFQRIGTPRTPTDIPSTPMIVQAVPKETKQVSWQQRVFIVDLQRFNTLMMSPTTTAKEVIDALETQGQLANWAGVGGWMLFEVSQDFGMGECHSRLACCPLLADTVTHCRETNPAFRGCVGSHQFLG
jgi:hypothetical protein